MLRECSHVRLGEAGYLAGMAHLMFRRRDEAGTIVAAIVEVGPLQMISLPSSQQAFRSENRVRSCNDNTACRRS